MSSKRCEPIVRSIFSPRSVALKADFREFMEVENLNSSVRTLATSPRRTLQSSDVAFAKQSLDLASQGCAAHKVCISSVKPLLRSEIGTLHEELEGSGNQVTVH